MTRNNMHQQLKMLISLVLIVIMMGSVQPSHANADWSDDFPLDGRPSGWELFAYMRGDNGGGGPHTETLAANLQMEVTNGVLMSPYYDDNAQGYPFSVRTLARHSSTQTHGNWSFDWITSGQSGRAHGAMDDLWFMSTCSSGTWNLSGLSESEFLSDKTALALQLVSRDKVELGTSADWPPATPGISLFEINSGEVTYLAKHHIEEISGTNKIRVDRNETNHVKVYYNNELIIENVTGDISKSEYFHYSSILGDSGIDNVAVVGIPEPSTSTTTPPVEGPTVSDPDGTSTSDSDETTWRYILIGGGMGAIFIAVFGGRAKKNF